MPRPQEICLEDLDLDVQDEAYLRCVALPGGEPGLALDRAGVVSWMQEDQAAYELWVSADDRLALLRDASAGPISVERQGRAVEAPVGQPVILLDQDMLRINGRRLVVHIHGETDEIYEPEPLGASAFGKLARAAATALALGAATLAGPEAQAGTLLGEQAPIEVRKRPPKPAPRRYPVKCNITSQKVSQGKLRLKATCPSGAKVHKGLYGEILDAKGNGLKNGRVKITAKVGDKIDIEATVLSKAVRATKVRFFVRGYGF